MKMIHFTVEKTKTGFSAYANDFDSLPVGSTGKNVIELRNNLLEAANLYLEHTGKKPITLDQIRVNFDLSSFFEFYPEINTSALGARIGMHKSLLSDYVNGRRKPSEKQISKIIMGVKELGKELTELEIA